VAVLRLSGPGCGAVLDGLCRRPAPRMASLRRLRHGGLVLDQALVLWFPGPASYTGEDSAELQLHGGPAVVAAVADALVALGARPAEPGEFTRRAFLHGKLDLTAAEGVADLIEAETEAQRRQALRQVEGGLEGRYQGWAGRLARLLARQETFIEFEDEDLPEGLDAAVARDAAALRDELAAEIAGAARAEALREGLRIAILGAPNAGKSSLLNALAGREAAIVSPQAGTTRDVVEARVVIAGVPVLLADTAGLRETADAIEAEGVRRARAQGQAAELVLAVFAADAAPDAETLALLEAGALAVVNKADLAAPALAGIAVSARTGAGLPALRAALEGAVRARAGLSDVASLTRPRHRAALADTIAALDALPQAALPELRAEALRAAMRALGRLTGAMGVEAILDLVFSEFCIGK
jgi:tRNA modification GTPase